MIRVDSNAFYGSRTRKSIHILLYACTPERVRTWHERWQDMTAKLERLAEYVDEAHETLNKAFEREFPIGTRITWLYRGIHVQSGTVEYCHPFGNTAPQMRVLNDRTGKLVWVGLFEKPKRK